MQTRPNLRLVNALRETARKLEAGAVYNWTHMGRCNCGHLAQTVTNLDPAEIHRKALEKAGDWAHQTVEHCTGTGLTMDHIIETMLDLGLTRQDLIHLERLSDQRVLKNIELERRVEIDHRKKEDVVLYLRTWAGILEEQLAETVDFDAKKILERTPEMSEKNAIF